MQVQRTCVLGEPVQPSARRLGKIEEEVAATMAAMRWNTTGLNGPEQNNKP
jgi:hypothetical protein